MNQSYSSTFLLSPQSQLRTPRLAHPTGSYLAPALTGNGYQPAAIREQSLRRPRTQVSHGQSERKALFSCCKVSAARQGQAGGDNQQLQVITSSSAEPGDTYRCGSQGNPQQCTAEVIYLIGNAGWHSETTSAPWLSSPAVALEFYKAFVPSSTCWAQYRLCGEILLC